jgi:hypothetical protein
VPRFLTSEWVAAFNLALDGVEINPDDTRPSLVAESGSFSVEQVVANVPPSHGTVRTVLTVAPGTLTLRLVDQDSEESGANVVVSLTYDAATALAQGALDPARALGEGRIRVHGDLAVLVASQAILAAATRRLEDLQSVTTY